MTNSIFDFSRFGRLLRAHWAENWRDYAWFAGVLIILDLITMAIAFSKDSSYSLFQYSGQAQWYMTGLSMSAVIFAGRYFRYLLNPGASLIALMRPASVFEKWLMAFLVISILYPLAYTLLYMIFNYPAVQMAKNMSEQLLACDNCHRDFHFFLPLLTTDMAGQGSHSAENSMKGQMIFFLLLSGTQALLAGGTAYFKRSPVLRTVLGTFLLFVISMWMGISPQLGTLAGHFGKLAVQHSAMEYALTYSLWLGLPLLLWVALFFHIKEREVA
ncbi:hypothetical protein ACO0LF_27075 [Undibacterium sp. Di27W]|uniref:hypothetical protein n=1 Tax=Undibacterium sp. Di27W TaxID=3413036 RepID=UPI003BF162BD